MVNYFGKNQMMAGAHYTVLDHLEDELYEKRPGLAHTKSFFHHDPYYQAVLHNETAVTACDPSIAHNFETHFCLPSASIISICNHFKIQHVSKVEVQDNAPSHKLTVSMARFS